MKRYIFLILIILTVGCKKKYEEGFAKGKIDGLVQGQIDGENEGYADGHIQGVSETYDLGHADGYASGLTQGYSEGSAYFATAGSSEGYSDGYYDGGIRGHMAGYETGYTTSYDQYYNSNYDISYNEGYYDGRSNGYEDGYDDGGWDGFSDNYDNGYDDGYSSGYYDGYGNSLKSKNPSVKLAAMVNSDLIDYSKLQKFQAKHSMGLSHADNGTLDMEKLAALKEKHYLNQMSHQIQARFGLSTDRSLKIATVAHQFNKTAGTRELTEKDAEVFAVGVMGTSLKNIELALKKSMRGESELFNNLLNNIATHNGVTPEKINSIIGEIFF